MKFYLVLFLVSFGAQAGLFKSDFLLEKDNECILDLSRVSNRNYMIPDKHVLNCIVHNKNKNLRICEVGDEFAIKDDPNRKLMVKSFKFKGNSCIE